MVNFLNIYSIEFREDKCICYDIKDNIVFIYKIDNKNLSCYLNRYSNNRNKFCAVFHNVCNYINISMVRQRNNKLNKI